MFNIRFVLAAGVLSLGGAALASAQQPAAPQGVQRIHGQRSDSARKAMGARGLRGQLFKGITLSNAEKANLKKVQTKYASQMKAQRQQFKPEAQAARDARQRGDTAALRSLWQKSAGQREQNKQLLTAERNDMRAALTPANQSKFDANVQALDMRLAKHGKGGKPGIHRAPGKPVR